MVLKMMLFSMQRSPSKPVSVSGSKNVRLAIPAVSQRGRLRQANEPPTERGAAALVTVIIVMVATLSMAVTAAKLGLGELEIGVAAAGGEKAFAVADGCLEETLRRIRLDTDYGVGSGTINLTVPNGSCTIEVSASGSSRTIDVTGTHDNYHAKLQSVISLSGNIIAVTSWQVRDE